MKRGTLVLVGFSRLVGNAMRPGTLRKSSAGIAAVTLAATMAVGVATAVPASADQPKQTFVTGLTQAAGTIIDPAGRVWVADRKAGFCRIQEPTGTTPGRIDHPLTSTDTTAPTCLGGTLDQAGQGPKVPGAPAFMDPDGQPNTGDELVFIPDETPGGSQVIRAKWNVSTQEFDYWDTLQIFDGDLRPNAVSLGADKNIYLTFDRTRVIARLTYPEIQHPSIESIASASGAVTGIAAAGLSGGRNIVYVAEASGITRFTAPPDETLANITPTAAFNVPKAGALMFDSSSNTLYAGTSIGTTSADAGKDSVIKVGLANNAVDTQWALGYSKVTGLGMLGGKVLVMDDSGLLSSPPPTGKGVMYRLSGAVVSITGGPTLANGQAAPNPAFTNDSTPTFTVSSTPAGSMQCTITPSGSSTPVWTDCTSGTYTPATPLADGAYTFQVSATGGGTAASRDFTVDTQAPVPPTITSPTSTTPVNGSPTFNATAETGATFVCAIDTTADASFTPCTPGSQLSFTTEGQHTLYVKAVDKATNRSTAASVVVQVDLTPPQLSITSPTDGSTVTVSQNVDVVFSSTSTDVDRFLCRMDTQAFTACTSPKTFTNVTAGQHRFEVQAIDKAGNSTTAGVTVTVNIADTTPPTVTASPAAGTYGPSQSITLAANEPATIYYTTDNSTPTTSSTQYSGPIAMATMTLKFFGVDSSKNASTVQSVAYVLDNTAPTVSASPAPGTYPSGQQITLSSSEPGSIYYTVDGSTPTTSSTKYTGPITLNGPLTIKAIAVDPYGNTSAPASFAYQVPDTTPPVVSASPAGGQYASGTKITLNSNEANTAIYYTTDGSTPTTSSTKYSTQLTLAAAMTLKFFGVDAAGNASGVVTETYTVTPAVVPWKDYTKDGKNDVVAIDSSANGYIYPGDGTGGWLTRISSGTWTGLSLPTATRDLDGDGISDLVARDSSGTLWLYPGNGTGGWKARTQLATGLGTANLITAPGDFTGDGKSDLLIRDTTGALWLYPGTGTGTLGTRTQVGWGWDVMNAITSTGDFNGDGKSDLLARDANGALWLYPGTGTGGFGTRTQVGSGWSVMNAILGIGDFNGDGKNDILARDTASGGLYLYPGNGTGGWLTRTQVGWGWNGLTLP
ncbi:chitobiase/beta-hexosaminidase C-terminal domain-containing protein [Pseudomonas sp. BAgro211]|nr:chitobiase/beta-hexosaminidase C-terminal domain-containing protein [Pseudomonas sp. BAgro211]